MKINSLLIILIFIFGCRALTRSHNQLVQNNIKFQYTDSVRVIYSSLNIVVEDTQRVIDSITIINLRSKDIYLPLSIGMGANSSGAFTLDIGILSSQKDIFLDGNRNNSSDRIAYFYLIKPNNLVRIVYKYGFFGKPPCTKVHYRVPIILNSFTLKNIDSSGLNFPLLFRIYRTDSFNVRFINLFDEKCK